MRAVIQRVRNAEVKVDDKITGQIGQGLLILLGVGPDDSESNADELVKKICNLRIFRDSQDKMNLSVKDIDGEILVVSQFTLYADTKKGNRPSYIKALNGEEAVKLYDLFNQELKKFVPVETGIFGAEMEVSLINDGPITILLEKENV